MKKLPYFPSIGYHVLGYVFRLSRELLLICGNMASRVHSPQNKIAPYTTARESSHLIWLQWHIRSCKLLHIKELPRGMLTLLCILSPQKTLLPPSLIRTFSLLDIPRVSVTISTPQGFDGVLVFSWKKSTPLNKNDVKMIPKRVGDWLLHVEFIGKRSGECFVLF